MVAFYTIRQKLIVHQEALSQFSFMKTFKNCLTPSFPSIESVMQSLILSLRKSCMVHHKLSQLNTNKAIGPDILAIFCA